MISAVNTGFFNALKLYPEKWVKNTTYAVGDFVKATTYNDHTYLCTVAGTSHATTEPTWSTTNGATQTDGTVTWKVFDRKLYQVKTPQGSTVPYVTFGLLTESPIGTFADFEAIENLTFWVNCFAGEASKTYSNALNDLMEIVDEVMASLDDVTLSVTGYTPMKCQREFISSPTYDPETNIFMISLRYRIHLSKG